ncbi:hypothetical protein [Actinokineospora sp.]
MPLVADDDRCPEGASLLMSVSVSALIVSQPYPSEEIWPVLNS